MNTKIAFAGSPFQMPARLAVGLGLESGLGTVFSGTVRPVLNYRGLLGLPHPASGRKPDFGCNIANQSSPSKFVNVCI
ncbi:MAG: hypothetical protein KGR98_15120, partial [Verrucomicrobia bacterium]|nr:hypothetical protein [Verrucomicrobiota bacterium]